MPSGALTQVTPVVSVPVDPAVPAVPRVVPPVRADRFIETRDGARKIKVLWSGLIQPGETWALQALESATPTTFSAVGTPLLITDASTPGLVEHSFPTVAGRAYCLGWTWTGGGWCAPACRECASRDRVIW